MPTVAILGASTDRTKFGNKSVRAHVAKGYTVYPINPKAAEVEGIAAFASLADIPEGKLDRVSVYLPPKVGITMLPQIAARGCDELWLNPGTESDELVAEAERLGLNVIQACSIVAVGVSPHDLH